VIAKHIVERRLVVTLAFVETLEDEHTGKAKLTTGKGAWACRGNRNAPGRDNTAAEFLASFGINDWNRCSEDATGSEHCAIANPSTFGHDATASN